MIIQYLFPKKGDARDLQLSVIDKKTNAELRFRTYITIEEKEWDHARQRPKNPYLKSSKKVNTKMEAIRLRILEVYRYKRNREISSRTINRIIRNISLEKQVSHPRDSFLLFVQQYIASRRHIICHSTFKRYMVFFRFLERYQGARSKRLMTKDLNDGFIQDFIDFGRSGSYSESTIYRTLNFVKNVLNFAEKKGIRTSVREFEIRRKAQQRELVTISEDEILRITNCEVPAVLKAAREWLLISCYTGQRISDFMEFTRDKLIEINGIVCISFVQKKTRKEITLPLHPAVTEVIRRNNGNFPQPLDALVYNRQIRQIARLAGLHHQIRARKRIGHRTKTVLTQKWQVITSHIGRRSFATNFFGKIPTALLMEATGHSTEEMFLKYINRTDNNRIASLNGYFHSTYTEGISRTISGNEFRTVSKHQWK